MMRSYENKVGDVPGVGFGIVGPDGYEAMLQNSRDFAQMGIPHIFDPGQAMPLYNGAELKQMIEQATYVTVNDYESNLLQERTGLSEKQIAERVKGYLITRGPAGSEIHTTSGMVHIPAANAMRVVDPTGCGDAYRAGLIFGLMKGMDLATTGRIASLMGALKIESLGPQNHRFSYEQFAEQFRQQFGYALR
jgi:adenosine kinase